jgi:hypothetical protein
LASTAIIPAACGVGARIEHKPRGRKRLARTPWSTADWIWVTSLIRSRITAQKVAGKNGRRTTVIARFGLLDRTAQCNLCNLLRTDTPHLYKPCMTRLGQMGSWAGSVWQKTLKECQVVTHFKYQLLAAVGIGGAVAVGAWYAGPWLLVLMSSVGGFAAAVAVQGWLWLRNALGLQGEQSV